ncbi:(Fe-S)-binding protein [Desulfolucanica intricata]|uniref:(Fe-S)-binding protein n=1 Tax=Desulfolucanica intricata TaxID=1285191 RepID=UPI00082BC2A2|nr:(Fe-S)-binding protein [Desulfolucanica intricata]
MSEVEARIPMFEIKDVIVEYGGEDITQCMQCGVCVATCPWKRVGSEFTIREMMHMGRMGYEGYESDDILFACTTCNHCATRCPRGVKIPNIVRVMRSMICESGAMPKNLKAVVGSINSQGNPWSQDKSKRENWAKEADVPAFTEETEYLLYVCCTSAFDSRSQKIAKSIAEMLKKAGVSFGVLSAEEKCCGESIRKIGAEDAFSALAEHNVNLFNSKGVKKIITTSPHCHYTFKNEYPAFGGEYEVYHYTEIINQLAKDGKLNFANSVAKKVIYHEPCYLGRHAQIFDAPRELMTAVPDLEVLEFDNNKNDSLCCGGGGSRIWMETEAHMRFSDAKVDEASAKEVNYVVTACPYCVVMFEDSVKTKNKDDVMAVKDISEILKESLG